MPFLVLFLFMSKIVTKQKQYSKWLFDESCNASSGDFKPPGRT